MGTCATASTTSKTTAGSSQPTGSPSTRKGWRRRSSQSAKGRETRATSTTTKKKLCGFRPPRNVPRNFQISKINLKNLKIQKKNIYMKKKNLLFVFVFSSFVLQIRN